MAKIAVVTLIGKSKKTYDFNVYPIDEECPNEAGVYVFSKREKNSSGDFAHTFIYIGMAKSFEKRFYNHHKDDCIDKKGANCICLKQFPKEQDRIDAEKDLLANYNTPCNEVNN